MESKDGTSYLSYTYDDGFFKFDSIDKGVYTLTIYPDLDSTIYDTVKWVNPNGESVLWVAERYYCPIREDYLIDTHTHQNIYMLFTVGAVLHGDGFPQVCRLFKKIPIHS